MKLGNAISVFRVTPFISLFICSINLSAQKDSAFRKPDYYIDVEQNRIDKFDGKLDGRIKLSDSASTDEAGKVYLKLVDSIQKLIESPKFDEARKRIFRESVYIHLRKVNQKTVYFIKTYETLFRFIIGELNNIQKDKLYEHLKSNIPQALRTIEFFADENAADSFLIFASGSYPERVFGAYNIYRSKSYSGRVIEEATKAAPVTAKRYFNPGEPVYETLKKSNDSAVRLILSIKEKLSRKTNAFVLLDDIVNGNLSLEEADEVSSSHISFLRAMLKIRAKKNPLAVHSLEQELEIYSLKFVRVLNDLHNEKDEVRFASVEDFSPEEIYTLIVYSEEEIFTSTFNGLFNRMMKKLGPVSGFEFLGKVGDNRFRTFIKMAAGFGKLSQFLQSMTTLHRQMLIIKFASGLELYRDLSQAVEVADAFASISDSLILRILRGAIKYEYIRLSTENNFRGTTIYSLLSSLFVERNITNPNWFSSVSKQYSIPNVGNVSNAKMFDRKNIDRWLIYFYDDEDGDASFASFLKIFTDKNWRVADSGSYVIIKSLNGKMVHIYANKPKHEYDGQEKLEKLFSQNDFTANVMVHRGHSYYAGKTIEKLKENTQVFVLGSCGGYHSISSIIERAPEAGIISSKQIGTQFVNNPMLKLLAEYVRSGNDVDWKKIWDELEVAVKSNPLAYERFLDYIPPHKNLGAIFIKAYNKMMEQE